MPVQPAWLPALLSTNGEWDEIVDRLYRVFDATFTHGHPHLRGIPIWWDRHVAPGDQYEAAFWHLITRDDRSTGERLLDPRRAERLCWCGPALQHADDASVLVWNYREQKRDVRTYVWLADWDYVIVLQMREKAMGPVYYLITAFHVDGSSRRRNLRRKYEQRIA